MKRFGYRRIGLSLGVAVTSVAGCSVVLGVDADRHVATPAPDAAAGPWDCLGAPGEQRTPNEHVELTLVVMDALQPSTSAGAIDGGSDLDTVSGAWLPGVAVRSCALRDLGCSSGSTAVVTSDAGTATFRLMQDFSGFFDMRRSDLVPATLYPGNFLTGQSVASFPAYDISPDGLRVLATSITHDDVALDPDGGFGHALVTVYDCLDHQAPGVLVTYGALGARAVPFYFKDGLPSATAAETDGFGLAGAINLPVGGRTATATLPGGGPTVGTTSFLVRPASITFAWIRVRTH